MAENHVIKYDSALKDLNATFGAHVSTIKGVVEEYKKLNTEFSKIPSEYISRLEKITDLNERLEQSERKVNQAKKEAEQTRKREVEDYQRRAKAFDQAEKQAQRLEAQERKRAEQAQKAEAQRKKDAEQARKREVEDYQRRARAFDQAEKQAQKAEAQRKKEAEQARKQAERAEAQRKKEVERLKQVNNAYNQAQAALKRLSAEYNHLAMRKQMGERLTKQELSDLKQLRKEVLSYQNALKSVDAQRGVFNRNVGNYASGVGNIGGQVASALGYAGAIYGAVNLARQSFRTIVDFDSGLLNVAKTTGLAGEELNTLGINIRGLAEELRVVPINNLLEYATVAGQLGVRGSENIVKFTKALSMLETASDISGQRGGAEIARFLTLVEGGVENVDKFGDEIVRLGNNFAATETEILSNAESIAQNVKIFNIGRQDVLAYATATRALGIESEVVGSTFQKTLGVFEKTIRTGKGLGDILNVIGGSAEDLQERFKDDASGVFLDYVEGLNKIHQAGGSVMAQMERNGIVDIRQRRVIGTLAAGYETLERAMLDVRDAAGAMEEEFDTAASKIQNQITAVKVAWDELVLSINSSENVIGDVAVAWLGGIELIINGIRKATTSARELQRLSQNEQRNQGYSSTADFFGNNYGSSEDVRELAVSEEIKYRKELTKLNETLKSQEAELFEINNRSWLQRLASSGDANVEIRRNEIETNMSKTAENISYVEGKLEALDDMYNNWRNSLEEPIETDLVEGLAEDEVKKTEKGLNKVIDLQKDRISAEHELQKAILQTAILEAQISGDSELYYTKEQELALLERNYKLAMAEREVTDKALLTQRKLTIEEEYNQKIIKLNDTEFKAFEKSEDEKAKAHQKYLQKRLKMMQGVYEDMLRVINDAYDKEMAILRLQEQGFDYKGLEYWENRENQLDLMLKSEKISLEEHNLEIENLKKERKQIFRDYVESFNDLGQFGFGSLNKFLDGEYIDDVFISAFDEIWAGADTLEEKFSASFLAMSEVAMDFYNVLNQGSKAYFEHEYANLELQKEVAIKYAGESAEARERIEEQYQAKKNELKRQEAQQEKQSAMFSAIINTAAGVVAALANPGGPAGIILAALVGVLGAVQIASIASTPLPQFWKGTDNAPQGWAIVDEKRPEVHTDKKGNIKSFGYSGGANLRFLEQGDKIYPSHEAFINEMGMSAPINGVIEGYSAIDYERMEAIMAKTVGRMTLQQNIIDEGGFKRYTVKGNSRTELKNRRILKS